MIPIFSSAYFSIRLLVLNNFAMIREADFSMMDSPLLPLPGLKTGIGNKKRADLFREDDSRFKNE